MNSNVNTKRTYFSGRRGTGCAGPQAASPATGEAAARSESATGVR